MDTHMHTPILSCSIICLKWPDVVLLQQLLLLKSISIKYIIFYNPHPLILLEKLDHLWLEKLDPIVYSPIKYSIFRICLITLLWYHLTFSLMLSTCYLLINVEFWLDSDSFFKQEYFIRANCIFLMNASHLLLTF